MDSDYDILPSTTNREPSHYDIKCTSSLVQQIPSTESCTDSSTIKPSIGGEPNGEPSGVICCPPRSPESFLSSNSSLDNESAFNNTASVNNSKDLSKPIYLKPIVAYNTPSKQCLQTQSTEYELSVQGNLEWNQENADILNLCQLSELEIAERKLAEILNSTRVLEESGKETETVPVSLYIRRTGNKCVPYIPISFAKEQKVKQALRYQSQTNLQPLQQHFHHTGSNFKSTTTSKKYTSCSTTSLQAHLVSRSPYPYSSVSTPIDYRNVLKSTIHTLSQSTPVTSTLNNTDILRHTVRNEQSMSAVSIVNTANVFNAPVQNLNTSVASIVNEIRISKPNSSNEETTSVISPMRSYHILKPVSSKQQDRSVTFPSNNILKSTSLQQPTPVVSPTRIRCIFKQTMPQEKSMPVTSPMSFTSDTFSASREFTLKPTVYQQSTQNVPTKCYNGSVCVPFQQIELIPNYQHLGLGKNISQYNNNPENSAPRYSMPTQNSQFQQRSSLVHSDAGDNCVKKETYIPSALYGQQFDKDLSFHLYAKKPPTGHPSSSGEVKQKKVATNQRKNKKKLTAVTMFELNDGNCIYVCPKCGSHTKDKSRFLQSALMGTSEVEGPDCSLCGVRKPSLFIGSNRFRTCYRSDFKSPRTQLQYAFASPRDENNGKNKIQRKRCAAVTKVTELGNKVEHAKNNSADKSEFKENDNDINSFLPPVSHISSLLPTNVFLKDYKHNQQVLSTFPIPSESCTVETKDFRTRYSPHLDNIPKYLKAHRDFSPSETLHNDDKQTVTSKKLWLNRQFEVYCSQATTKPELQGVNCVNEKPGSMTNIISKSDQSTTDNVTNMCGSLSNANETEPDLVLTRADNVSSNCDQVFYSSSEIQQAVANINDVKQENESSIVKYSLEELVCIRNEQNSNSNGMKMKENSVANCSQESHSQIDDRRSNIENETLQNIVSFADHIPFSQEINNAAETRLSVGNEESAIIKNNNNEENHDKNARTCVPNQSCGDNYEQPLLDLACTANNQMENMVDLCFSNENSNLLESVLLSNIGDNLHEDLENTAAGNSLPVSEAQGFGNKELETNDNGRSQISVDNLTSNNDVPTSTEKPSDIVIEDSQTLVDPIQNQLVNGDNNDSKINHSVKKLDFNRSKTKHRCSRCGKVYLRESSLNTHIKFHDKYNGFKCETCGRIFRLKYGLRRHIAVHTSYHPYECDICKKTFAAKGNLATHIYFHIGYKPYSCNECQRSFTMRGHLITHYRFHTGDRPFRCKICSRAYVDSGVLASHLRQHSGERAFKCDTCAKSFISKPRLEVHLLTHSKFKRFVCGICGCKYNRKEHLERHRKKHSGHRPFMCFYCGRAFVRKEHAERHEKLHETGNKRLKRF